MNPPSSSTGSGLWRLRLGRGASALRQAIHGFLLPLIVLHALMRDPADRKRYLKITLTQALLTLGIAIALVPVFRQATRMTDEVEHEAEVALQKTLGVVQSGISTAVAKRDAPDDSNREEVLASLDQSATDFRSELDALKVAPPPAPEPPIAIGPGSPGRVPPPGAPPPPPPPTDPRQLEELKERARIRIQRREQQAQQNAEEREEDAADRAEDAQARQQEAAERQAEAVARQVEAAQRLAERQAEAAERAAQREADNRERQDELRERAAEARERAQDNAQELREAAAELRQAAQEAAAEAQEAVQESPELAAQIRAETAKVQQQLARDQAQLERELARNQAQLAREMAQLQRSTEGLAKLSALRATEAVRIRAGEVMSGAEVEARLETLSERLEAGLEDEALNEQQRVELSMQAAVEASFVAEQARSEARRLRNELRRNTALDDEAREQLEEELEEAEERAAEARTLARTARSEAKEGLKRVAIQTRRTPETPETPQLKLAEAMVDLSPFELLLVYLAALYAALYFVQFLVITFSRDYHDLLSRKAALATGIEPEDPDMIPRVRLDWHWLKTRLLRRWRAIKMFAFGVPVIYLVTWPIPGGEPLRNALLSVWGAYWFAVFVAAKSARAWVDEGLARDPWFLRWANAAASRVKLLRTLPFRLYGSLWRRHGSSVFAPAECVEQQPYAFAGLTVFRFIASLPLLKIFLRPLTPIAVAHLLEAHRVDHPPRAARVEQVLRKQTPPPRPPDFATVH